MSPRAAAGHLITGVLVLCASAAHAQGFDILRILQTYAPVEIAALKVVTSQVASASKAKINTDVMLASGGLAGRAALEATMMQAELFRTYGVVSGQGAQTCSAVNQRNDIDAIERRRDALAFTAMPTGGRSLVARDNYEAIRTEQRLDAYCSADEHNLGLCRSRFDGMAAASTNYSKVIVADQFTPKQLRAAQEFVANLVPPPPPLQRASDCTASCQVDRMRALRADALSSVVAVPMAAQLSNRVGQKTFAAPR